MSKPLPYKNFKWSDDLTLDLNNLQTGIYEVDIEIPEELHDKFRDYPLCPEIKNISENMLSEYQKYLNDKLNIKYNSTDKKLILDLLPKKNYKVYYKNLEYQPKSRRQIKDCFITFHHSFLTATGATSFIVLYTECSI